MSPSTTLFQKEKESYWQMRGELLEKYLHQWVAVAGGRVVAAGDSAEDVMSLAYQRTKVKALYINKVGDEAIALRKKIRRGE